LCSAASSTSSVTCSALMPDVLRISEASAEMTELLHHTYLDRSHKIAMRIAEATEQVRRRADRSPNGAEILGAVADMIEYQLAPAQKAMATKAKKVATNKGDEPAKVIEPTP
jgi:hypothetical protein